MLQANDFEFESYADDGSNSDPIAYRTEDMKGWFINFHTSCCGTAAPPIEQMAVEYGELISNRFAGDLPVRPAGKVSGDKYSDINRVPTLGEMARAYELARKAGLHRFDERRQLAV